MAPKGAAESKQAGAESPADDLQSEKQKSARREIKGGIPYSTSPGVLKRALELIIPAERPDKFTANYMEPVLKLRGGAARAVPPFLKKMQFIGPDGAPTSLFSKFKTDSGRSQAAYEGLKNAFGELFRRNEYIYKADEGAVRDVIVEITGLKKPDPIVRMIYSSFDAVRSFVVSDVAATPDAARQEGEDNNQREKMGGSTGVTPPRLGLSYQINIVLPETENVSVFNAIFKSLRDNLLR